jgi:hypothetical protein
VVGVAKSVQASSVEVKLKPKLYVTKNVCDAVGVIVGVGVGVVVLVIVGVGVSVVVGVGVGDGNAEQRLNPPVSNPSDSN